MKDRSPGVRVKLEVGDDTPPLYEIYGIAEGLRGMEARLKDAVSRARAAGHSWQEIADQLGVTRQSAWERFGGSEEDERATAIASVAGSLEGPGPTSDEMREITRREELEAELRKWGSSPPGLKWRS
jgi:hypothetical protein